MIDKDFIGSDFDDFLRNEGFIEDAEAVAAKRVIAFQIAEEMKKAISYSFYPWQSSISCGEDFEN